ncbi:MAG: phosphatidylglycerol lysyltransferase domain-containing protein [Gammaproteobacteria bacterium]|nr:phosphatidylglycerol lysyltransferase domain-containing protein [Gammaproteobacteria bacterium]
MLAGDKRLLFSDDERGFVMYQVRGRSWVALGDPVGRAETHAELLWRFRELCDRHDGRPIFYQISAETLPSYIDLGLTALKLGEEARVGLAEFSLDGKARAGLRQSHRRAEREGASFAVLTPEQVAASIEEIEAISGAWLADKHTAEKAFSVGAFSREYIVQFPCAVVRRDAHIVAFANLLASGDRNELTLDLMRHGADAPPGVMDYLFVELMLMGKAESYRWFSLGMAPLSGFEAHRLAPLWHRLGGLIYRHGEHFYNFEGLRHYKDKFRPVWTPRYLVSPGGVALPRMLLDIAALISGGYRRIVAK